MVTTIQVDESLKKKLDLLKAHYRETYNDILRRLIDSYSDEDKESLTETIEIMSDPETMRDLAQAMEDYKKGRGKTLDQIKKELNL